MGHPHPHLSQVHRCFHHLHCLKLRRYESLHLIGTMLGVVWKLHPRRCPAIIASMPLPKLPDCRGFTCETGESHTARSASSSLSFVRISEAMSAIDTRIAMPLLFLGPAPLLLLDGRTLFLRSGMPGAWLRNLGASGDEAFEAVVVAVALAGLCGADMTGDRINRQDKRQD